MTKSNQIVTETITDPKKVANHLFGYIYEEDAVVCVNGEFRVSNSYQIESQEVVMSPFDNFSKISLTIYVSQIFEMNEGMDSMNGMNNMVPSGLTVLIRDCSERILLRNMTMESATVTNDVEQDIGFLANRDAQSIGKVAEYTLSCNSDEVTIEKLSTS
ncbi:MAG: hypothetical protein J07AB43_01090 [Candidatus Nanosalina sp. J07AB43]|nr:MAG: hypothetical protein J07AB43_01090 [Candidatus Nanosalina sp. J07AB43]